ncbi:hypothetical protein D0Z00_003126 [Geotrichum galactomycetum]|uniref:Uncharacterized protein n=1 Tax=Geotrichum galactomycetum TaxID=27317 RepID=A0ACB6V2F8_9ASCO|nr:hypothetical protein D0Z00_003126 [Geotrichum candidum]
MAQLDTLRVKRKRTDSAIATLLSGPGLPGLPQEQLEELSKEEDPTGLLSSMVESYLRVSGYAIKEPTRKRRHASVAGGSSDTAMDVATDNDMDYVYDVYYREHASTATAPNASAADIGLIVVDSDDEKLFGLEEDEEDSDYVLTDDEDSNGEESDDGAGQFYYDEDDYRDTYIGRTISDGDEEENDDDDGYNRTSRNNYHQRGYLGEDEDMEHYRDRIFDDLQRQIEKRKNISSQLKKQ